MSIRKCLTPKCQGTAAHRGLCLKCYSTAKRAVEGGETTWEELEQLGMVESVVDKFRAAFDAIRREKKGATDHQTESDEE